MKKVITFSLIIVLVVSLSGCFGSGKTMIGKKEMEWDGYYSISYIRFTGTRRTEIHIKEPQTVDLMVMTNFGELDLEIFGKDEDGKEHSLFYGEKIPTGSSQLYLEEGQYKIYLYGTNHSGGFTAKYQLIALPADKPETDDYYDSERQ